MSDVLKGKARDDLTDEPSQNGVINLALSDDAFSRIFTSPGLDPVKLSHVCRRWRSVAIATPAIWTALIYDGIDFPVASSVERFATYLERSKECPLNLRFHFGVDYSGEYFAAQKLLMDMNGEEEEARYEGRVVGPSSQVPKAPTLEPEPEQEQEPEPEPELGEENRVNIGDDDEGDDEEDLSEWEDPRRDRWKEWEETYEEFIFRHVFKLVVEHAHRWKYFYFSTSSSRSLVYFHQSIRILSVPILEHMAIHFEAWRDGIECRRLPELEEVSSGGDPSILLGGSPKLTGFKTFGIPSYYFLPNLATVTTFLVRDVRLYHVRYLAVFSQLECVSFSERKFSAEEQLEPLDGSRFILPSLKHLHLGSSRGVFSRLLSRLEAPNLLSLVLVGEILPASVDHFVTRSFSKVIFLNMISCIIGDEDANPPPPIVPFLTLFPNVRHILCRGFWERIAIYLTNTPYPHPTINTKTLVPRLRTFITRQDHPGRESAERLWVKAHESMKAFKGSWRRDLNVNPLLRVVRKITKGKEEQGWSFDVYNFPPDKKYNKNGWARRGDRYMNQDF